MREERVVLEDEPDAAPVRGQVDAARLEERLAVEDDPPLRRPHEPGDRVQHGRLPRAGRADERERLAPDLERYRELEGAKRMGEVELKRHRVSTFAASRIAALTATSSALIASASRKSTSNAS